MQEQTQKKERKRSKKKAGDGGQATWHASKIQNTACTFLPSSLQDQNRPQAPSILNAGPSEMRFNNTHFLTLRREFDLDHDGCLYRDAGRIFVPLCFNNASRHQSVVSLRWVVMDRRLPLFLAQRGEFDSSKKFEKRARHKRLETQQREQQRRQRCSLPQQRLQGEKTDFPSYL